MIERTQIAATNVPDLSAAWAFVMSEIEGHDRPDIHIRPLSVLHEGDADWVQEFEVTVMTTSSRGDT